MRALTILLIAAVAVAAPAAAQADPNRAQAEKLFRTGERLFDAGEFAMAAAAFEDAHELLPLPAIAFSAAQAYRLAWVRSRQPAQLSRAVALYRLYLDKVKSGERVTDATNALAELEPQLRSLEAGGRAVTAAPAARPSGLMITSEISPADGKIGNDPKLAGKLPLVRELPPGEYQVTVEAAGYRTKTIRATVLAGEMVPVEVDLEALPAVIAIKAEGGAQVAIDGRAVGTTPLARPIAVDAGRHFVAITRRGRYPVAREVALARGQTLELAPPMRTTTQRKVSRFVLAGAGLLAIGAGAAGLAALDADGDAADLDRKRQREGITPEELARYERLRGDRDQRALAMWSLGGAAVAVGTTGLLLYLFDRDQPEAPVVVPTAASGAAGVAVRGSF